MPGPTYKELHEALANLDEILDNIEPETDAQAYLMREMETHIAKAVDIATCLAADEQTAEVAFEAALGPSAVDPETPESEGAAG